MRNPIVLLLAVATLTACASVPLTTLWKMRNLTVERFFQNDPAQLRVAIQVDRALKRGPEQPKVEAEVQQKGRPPLCYAFSLAPVDPNTRGELPLDKPAPDRAWHVFALSPAGLDAFRRARREAAGIEKGTEGKFSLGVTMTNVFDIPDGMQSFPLRIDAVLDRKDGWFTLVKETAVAMKKPSKPAPPVPAPSSTPTEEACPQT